MVSLMATDAYEDLFRGAHNRTWPQCYLRFDAEYPTGEVDEL